METRFSEKTGIYIGAREVYSVSGRRNVTAWAHYDYSMGKPCKVGPWYSTKAEILADHESYLVRAGWLVEGVKA